MIVYSFGQAYLSSFTESDKKALQLFILDLSTKNQVLGLRCIKVLFDPTNVVTSPVLMRMQTIILRLIHNIFLNIITWSLPRIGWVKENFDTS